MILSWIFCLLYLTVATINTQHLTGSLEKQVEQKYNVFLDVNACTFKTHMSSLVDAFTSLHLCIKKQLFHCYFTNPSRNATGVSISTTPRNVPYCGSMWIQDNPAVSFWKEILIEMKDGHHIQLNMVLFKFSFYRHMLCQSHSISFVSEDFSTEAYCGVRVPWTLIIQNHRVFLRFSISNNKEYYFKLFYSSFHPNWISNLARILKSCHPPWSSINYFSLLLDMFEVNIVQYRYYIFARQYDRLSIFVALRDLLNIRLRIHDGPGPLSNELAHFTRAKNDKDIFVQSSAYSAFLLIEPVDFRQNASVTFHIRLPKKVATFRECATTFHKGSIRVMSNEWRTIACVYTFNTSSSKYWGISVSFFEFYGPNMVTDLPTYPCQYGGLGIEVEQKGRALLTCENVQDITIHSQYKGLTLHVAWFSGYSRGQLSAVIKRTYCKYIYANLSPPIGPHNDNLGTILKHDSVSDVCSFLVCPPSPNYEQSKCVIRLGPPHIGPALIKVFLQDYLDPCTPESYSVNDDITLTAVLSMDWPFISSKTISYQRYFLTRKFLANTSNTYTYLFNATITVPHLCFGAKPYKQLAVRLTVSTCSVTALGHQPIIMIANNIPGLTDHCLNVVIKFIFAAENNTKTENYPNNFIYPPTEAYENRFGLVKFRDFYFAESGYVYKTHEVRLIYSKCPTECRTYKYTTFIRSMDNTTVIEYTSKVGDYTLIQENHRGFRISISVDQAQCEAHLTCLLELSVARPPRNEKVIKGRVSSLLLSRKRYDIIIYISTITMIIILMYRHMYTNK